MKSHDFLQAAVLTAAALFATSAIPAGIVPAAPGNPDPFLAYLSTDKPIYRIGEQVYLRAPILNALSHQPLTHDTSAMLKITGPKGEILANTWTQSTDAIASAAWQVPDGAAGGQYTATFTFAEGYPPATRQFEVRAYRAPRLKGEIIFLRDGFGPGDTVKASLHVVRAEGGLPANATVTPIALIDGRPLSIPPTTIDSAGNCSVQFQLPTHIATPDATLSLTIQDGGTVEPIAKTIPILLHTVNLAFYPEGGDLIAGIPNRVYLEARTPAQKPADLVGTIYDSHHHEVATVKTQHEGRARFTFTPRANETYTFQLSQPAGIEAPFVLPAVKSTGVTLQSDNDITAADQPLRVNISSTSAATYTVTLSKKQTQLDSQTFTLNANETKPFAFTLPADKQADGVLIATVKDDKGTPLAERLVYRQPAHNLHISVTPNQSSYIPADAASLTVTTTDDAGHPVSALVGLTVTDDTVLNMIEKRDRAPHLPAMVLLETDVKELADADLYLNPNDPTAPAAVDLLLGTQGWRRFATADEQKFLSTYGDNARRAIAKQIPMPVLFGAVGGFALRDGDRSASSAVNAPEALGMMDRKGIDGLEKDKAANAAAGLPAASPVAAPPPLVPFQQKLEAADMAEANQFRRLRPIAPPVRIYAHDLLPNHSPDQRCDFTETLYWSAGIKTDEKTGTATVNFHLNDSVTTFSVSADAFAQSGALGSVATSIASVQPFYLEPKLPLEVTAGDQLQIPLTAVNNTPDPIDAVLTIDAGKPLQITPPLPPQHLLVPPNSRVRQLINVTIGQADAANPTANFTISAQANSTPPRTLDHITRSLLIKPKGFPTQIAKGGILNANATITHTIDIPASLVPGSLTGSANLYPTPLASLTDALQALLQEPNGCFEQTSSTTYPLVMADQYFLSHTGVDPALIAKSNDLLDKGYHRLQGFECKNKGYEWFGEDPGHECLSAFGLLEFTDMSQVRDVDKSMLQNTRTWLLARRDGKGGFSHERRSLHTWITDPGCANGYCTWALLETGEKKLDPEVDWLKARAAGDPNTYVTALAANVCFLNNDKEAAKSFMEKLAAQQDQDGHVKNATTSVVGSGGDALNIETTSLATLAWLRDPSFAGNVESAIRYLADSCKAGRYGSTQSTVLALRAIVAYDKARAHPTAKGAVQLFADDHAIGDAIPFDQSTQGAIQLPDPSELLSPGKHTLTLKMTDGSDLPYALAVNFNSLTPATSPDCKLGLETTLSSKTLAEGAPAEMHVTVTNRTGDTLPTPIAIIGLPGGLEPRHDQLKELVKAERIAAYEVRGREIILYWRDIQPNEKISLPLSLTAALPGTYTAPASRAYLYYTDENKVWLPGITTTITPK